MRRKRLPLKKNLKELNCIIDLRLLKRGGKNDRAEQDVAKGGRRRGKKGTAKRKTDI